MRTEATKKAWQAAHRRWFQLQDTGTWPRIGSPVAAKAAAAKLAAPAAARALAAHRLRQKHAAEGGAALVVTARAVPQAQTALAAARRGAAAARRGAAAARLEQAHARLSAAAAGPAAAVGQRLD